MDNLSHTMFGALLSAAIAPQLVKKNRLRLLIASAAVVNLPDIDIVLALVDRETYAFHHRGFTHSLLGLAVMIPLGMWVFQKIMKEPRSSEGEAPTGLFSVFYLVLAQLIIGHFLLDYLTTYGTMFFYPFAWERFSYPLMFIIDPLFWLVNLAGFMIVWRTKSADPKIYRKRAFLALALCCGLWTIELYYKLHAEQSAEIALTQQPDYQVQTWATSSYPAPLAPWLWMIVHSHADQQTTYVQSTFSYLRTPHVQIYPLPKGFFTEQLCPTESDDNHQPIQEFKRFQRWGEQVVCRRGIGANLESGCQCFSLKYSIMASGLSTFGKYFIPKSGPGFFMPTDSPNQLKDYYRTQIFGSAPE